MSLLDLLRLPGAPSASGDLDSLEAVRRHARIIRGKPLLIYPSGSPPHFELASHSSEVFNPSLTQ